MAMPLIYRSMRPDGARPLVEQSAKGLGVRVAASPCPAPPLDKPCPQDVHPDAAGFVSPSANAHGELKFEGMSVAPHWKELPKHRIPKRLNHHVKGARGENDLLCWQMGSGDFVNSKVINELHLYPDSPKHGVVAPATRMLVDDYKKHLESTVDLWQLIPEEPPT